MPANRAPEDIARRYFDAPLASLGDSERKVARHLASRRPVVHEADPGGHGRATAGERAADAVARFGGSWAFVGLFATALVLWVLVNSWWLAGAATGAFDPYPYILLNLFLSMLAAAQAPVILMSQNRQSQKDRIRATHDYEINLKAELEILLLHEKLDTLRERQWADLLAIQAEQSRLLAGLVARLAPDTAAGPCAPR